MKLVRRALTTSLAASTYLPFKGYPNFRTIVNKLVLHITCLYIQGQKSHKQWSNKEITKVARKYKHIYPCFIKEMKILQ